MGRLPSTLVAAFALAVAVSACSSAGDDDSASPSPPPSEAAHTEPDAAQTPEVIVLTVPAGYEEGPPAERGEWNDLLSGDNGCVLAFRGDVQDQPASDLRSASVDLVAAMATADDAAADEDVDLSLVTNEGATDQSTATLTFASSTWQTDSHTVRGAARVANVVTFDGSQAQESLELRLGCPSEAALETEWATVTENVRPVLHVDEADDSPWSDPSMG